MMVDVMMTIVVVVGVVQVMMVALHLAPHYHVAIATNRLPSGTGLWVRQTHRACTPASCLHLLVGRVV